MPIYKYKAIKENGKRTEGTYNSNTKNEVIQMLRENKYYPVKIEEINLARNIKLVNLFNKTNLKDIAIFCRQFYTMLDAGVSIISCLKIQSYQTENRKLRQGIQRVCDEVQKGLTFSEALKKHDGIFPELLINMVEAGEISGNLDVIMNRMAVHYEKESKIINKVKSAMVYPAILSVFSAIVVVFLLIAVIPNLVSMFKDYGIELSMPTKILLGVGNLIKRLWYFIPFIIGVIVCFISKFARTDKVNIYLDSLKFKLPIIRNTTEKVITSRFTRTLSTLLGSGVSLIQSLEIVSNVVGNKIVSNGIKNAIDEVRKGINLTESINNIGIFPQMVISMIKIGEESGSLEEILDKTANFYDDEVENAMQKMTTVIEPLMIVLMAIIIGVIVMAMVLPMFEMINTIQF